VEGRCEEALAVVEATPAGIVIANPAWNPWRSISAPLAWQGKFRSDRGFGSLPIWIGQPNTVINGCNSMARSTVVSDHAQNWR